jgi:glutathione S-transferase
MESGEPRGAARVLRLYHSPFSRSLRVLWLLEELGLEYELVTLGSIATAVPFSQATPTGKVPTLEDDGMVMFESIAILEYVLDRYGGGRLAPPRESRLWGPFLQWLHFAESTAFPPLGFIARHTFALPEAERSAQTVADSRAIANRVLAVPEHVLGGTDYLVGGGFTAADVAMGYSVGTAKLLGLLGSFPNLEAYFARLAARPAFQRANAKR